MAEEIIIDGVDVSKCNYAILPKKQCPMKSMPYAKETSCIACKEHNTKLNFCKNNPNCYFKQLNRKGRECEELKRIKNDFFKHAEVSHEAVLNKNKIIDEQAKELDQLKVENEELKKEINYMEGYIRTVENARDEFAQELKQKERALDEIKKIINIDYYQDSWATLAIKIDNIREIINKIKEIYPYG